MTFASKVNPQFDRYDRPYMLAVVVGLLTLVGFYFCLFLNDTFKCKLVPGEVSRLMTTDQDILNFFKGTLFKGGSKACIVSILNFVINENQQQSVVACDFGDDELLAQMMIAEGYELDKFKWCDDKFQDHAVLLAQAYELGYGSVCGMPDDGTTLPPGQFTPYLANLQIDTEVCENTFTALMAAFGFMPMVMRCATFFGAGILIMSKCVKPKNKGGSWYDRFSDLNTSHVVEILELQGKVADLNANNMELNANNMELQDNVKRILAKLEMKSVGDEKFVDNTDV